MGSTVGLGRGWRGLLEATSRHWAVSSAPPQDQGVCSLGGSLRPSHYSAAAWLCGHSEVPMLHLVGADPLGQAELK